MVISTVIDAVETAFVERLVDITDDLVGRKEVDIIVDVSIVKVFTTDMLKLEDETVDKIEGDTELEWEVNETLGDMIHVMLDCNVLVCNVELVWDTEDEVAANVEDGVGCIDELDIVVDGDTVVVWFNGKPGSGTSEKVILTHERLNKLSHTIQLTLVILTSRISNNRLSRSENLVPA